MSRIPGGHAGCRRQRCDIIVGFCSTEHSVAAPAAHASSVLCSTPATTVSQRVTLFGRGFLRGRLRFAASQLSEVATRFWWGLSTDIQKAQHRAFAKRVSGWGHVVPGYGDTGSPGMWGPGCRVQEKIEGLGGT